MTLCDVKLTIVFNGRHLGIVKLEIIWTKMSKSCQDNRKMLSGRLILKHSKPKFS